MSNFFTKAFIGKFAVVAAGLGLFGGLVAGLLVFTGSINLAANNTHPKWFYSIVHGTFKRWVAVQAGDVTAPDDLDDPGRIALGAQHYAQNCTRCHGGPGLGQNPMVLAMNPSPQHLPAVIDQFTDEELFVILEKGVMMSAMPAWPVANRADEIWSTVAFIRQIDEMTTAEYVSLVSPEPTDAPEMDFGLLAKGEPMDFYVTRYPMEEHLYSSPTGGFADYALSGVPVAQCATCHGADGSGAPTAGEAPNLSIQSASYIKAALDSYASGERESGYMQVVAAQLSDAQIDALSRYYGDTLPPVTLPMDTAPDAQVVALGETLAIEGRPVDGISACYDCHGLSGTDDAEGILVPRLAAQSQTYITRQLRQFRIGGRGQTSLWSPMTGVAHNLSDADIEGVSAYFAALSPDAMAPVQDETPPASPTQVATAEGLITQVCSECHEADLLGAPSGETPNLTLQGADYIQRQLYDFRDLNRNNSRMHQAALRLEDDDITAMSAYLGGLDPQPRRAPEPVSADMTLGEQLARRGFPDDGIPACLTCHGDANTSNLNQIPRLHGQNGNYLLTRLDYFQEGDPDEITDYSPMPGIARAMTDEQLAAAAAWFAEQAPLAKN